MAKENWGRWGPQDERGSLNWAGQEQVLAGARLIRQGRVFCLGMPISRDLPSSPRRVPPAHFMNKDSGDFYAGEERIGGLAFADDTILMPTHAGTHIDALSHAWYDDRLFNGHPANQVRSGGALVCGIEKIGAVVSRGVLLDIAGHKEVPHLPASYEITAQDLQTCAESQGVTVGEGDIVLLRTGWIRMTSDSELYRLKEPGPGQGAARWLTDRHIAATGADNYAWEVLTGPATAGFPVHQFLLRDCGVHIMENLVLDELAEAKAFEFLFVAAPLRIVGGTGSPLNPIAIA